jgi:beta-lactam-binding protein with PASTA domain
VIDQRPKEATSLKKGTQVTIVVDKAAKPKPATASATTTAPTTTAATTTAPTTTAQSPPPQPQSATMPDVEGQTETAAVESLGGAGILPSLVFVPGTDALGTVVQQAKPSGATLPFHAHVQLNLSRGPNNNPLESVPSVIGKTLNDAVAAMQAGHLRLIYLRYPVTSRAQAGEIVQQSGAAERAGARLPRRVQGLSPFELNGHIVRNLVVRFEHGRSATRG